MGWNERIVFGLSGSENQNTVLFFLHHIWSQKKTLCSTETCLWTNKHSFQSQIANLKFKLVALRISELFTFVANICENCKMEHTIFWFVMLHKGPRENYDLTEAKTTNQDILSTCTMKCRASKVSKTMIYLH